MWEKGNHEDVETLSDERNIKTRKKIIFELNGARSEVLFDSSGKVGLFHIRFQIEWEESATPGG